MKPNSYCITDRQFDELYLVSYTKLRLLSSITKKEVNREENGVHKWELGKDAITLEMRCKIWGRYGSNTIRRLLNYPLERDASRMTHGTLSIIKTSTMGESSSNVAFATKIPNLLKRNRIRRIVCATFKAKSCQKDGATSDLDLVDEDDEFWDY